MNAVYCQHTDFVPGQKDCASQCEKQTLTKTTNDKKEKKTDFNYFQFLLKDNQRVMEKTHRDVFFKDFRTRLKGSHWVVGLADTTMPRLPSEGQRRRVQPVALIGNFCCCRFPLSKGQSGTVH